MLTERIAKRLTKHQENSLLRTRVVLDKRDNNFIQIHQQSCINFCSNDYLGISQNSQVIQAFVQAGNKYGSGSTSSPLISGYSKIQQQVEESFAEFLNFEKTIFFNSGYLANIGVITTLADKNSIILSDKLCHASLLDAIQLSRAKHYRYKHNNLTHLSELLAIKPIDLIVTESVFSMEGDVAALPEIIGLAKKNKCDVIIDDAHGIGVLGKTGAGISEYFDLKQQDVCCLIAPLGKAIACVGGIVAGSTLIIEGILQFARSYRYSTALPPAMCSAILQSLKIIKSEHWRREKLNELITYFITTAINKGLAVISNDLTPIKSIIIGDNEKAEMIQRFLIKKGYFVSCIRPPTVPIGTARIRISLNCFHTKIQIDNLISELARLLCDE